MRADQLRRQRAGADHQHRRCILAGEVGGGQRRGGGGAPRGQGLSVDHRQHLAGVAGQQQILAHDGGQALLAIRRKDGNHLDADIAAGRPGRHQQQRCLGLARHLDAVMVAQRHRAALAEHAAQRFDQGVEGKRPDGAVGVDNPHGQSRFNAWLAW